MCVKAVCVRACGACVRVCVVVHMDQLLKHSGITLIVQSKHAGK